MKRRTKRTKEEEDKEEEEEEREEEKKTQRKTFDHRRLATRKMQMAVLTRRDRILSHLAPSNYLGHLGVSGRHFGTRCLSVEPFGTALV